jgi:hypothetical protein
MSPERAPHRRPFTTGVARTWEFGVRLIARYTEAV